MAQIKSDALELNYSDILFCFHFNDWQPCQHRVKEHTLAYLYSGALLIESGEQKQSIRAGECAFLPKNHKVNITKQPLEHEEFRSIFLVFDRKFLHGFYQEHKAELAQAKGREKVPDFVKLPNATAIKSLFYSLIPFFSSSVEPTAELMRLKQQEGLMALLDIDRQLCTTLFDFIEPWKIDILEFMNDNYRYELSLEDMALYTGRSLAAFKRDFQKVSSLSPQRWVMQRRLEAAREALQEGQKASDIYLGLGFKSLSHFSTAFKKQYGCLPQQLSD